MPDVQTNITTTSRLQVFISGKMLFAFGNFRVEKAQTSSRSRSDNFTDGNYTSNLDCTAGEWRWQEPPLRWTPNM